MHWIDFSLGAIAGCVALLLAAAVRVWFKRREICPLCKGEGSVFRWESLAGFRCDGEVNPKHTLLPKTITCPQCHGTGKRSRPHNGKKWESALDPPPRRSLKNQHYGPRRRHR